MPAGKGTYGSKRGRPPLSGKEQAQALAKKRIAKKKVEAKKAAVTKAVRKGLSTTQRAVKSVGKTLLAKPSAKRKALADAMRKRHNARKKK